MTPVESKRLTVGTAVCWQGDQNDRGEIVEANWHAVKIAWANGQVGIIDHGDMADVSLLQGAVA